MSPRLITGHQRSLCQIQHGSLLSNKIIDTGSGYNIIIAALPKQCGTVLCHQSSVLQFNPVILHYYIYYISYIWPKVVFLEFFYHGRGL